MTNIDVWKAWGSKVLYQTETLGIVELVACCIYLFSHLADTFIQSDLQMRTL